MVQVLLGHLKTQCQNTVTLSATHDQLPKHIADNAAQYLQHHVLLVKPPVMTQQRS